MTAPDAPRVVDAGRLTPPWHGHRPAPSPDGHRPAIQGRRAGLVTRLLAALLDAAVALGLLLIGYGVAVGVLFLAHPASFRFAGPPWALVLTIGYLVVVGYLSFAWATGGRTYGDRVMGLRVLDRRGRRPGWPLAVARAVLCAVVPLGLFWVLVSPRNRSVQDALLRTSVVYDWDAG